MIAWKSWYVVMSRIEDYSKWIIDKTVRYYGSAARDHKDSFIRTYSEEELDSLFADERLEDSRYYYILELLGGESASEVLLAFHLAVAVYLYPDFAGMVAQQSGGVSLRLAMEIGKKAGQDNVKTYSELYEGFIELSKLLKVDAGSKNFIDARLSADETLIIYLEGNTMIPEKLEGIATLYPLMEESTKLYGMDAVRNELSALFKYRSETEDSFFIQISGVYGSGRRTLVKAAADKQDLGVVFFDYLKVRSLSREEKEKLLWYALREAILYDAALCIYGIEADERGDTSREIVKWMESILELDDIQVVFCTDENIELAPSTDRAVERLDLSIDDMSERIEVWKGYSEEFGYNIDCEYYASKYILPPGQLKKMFMALKRKNVGNDIFERKLYESGLEVIKKPEYGNILSTKSDAKLESLKLPEEQKTKIFEICDYIKNGYQVFEKWQMSKTVKYGKGMTALFIGRPGTGKTMAAECIAGSLGLPLYHVNLSQILDKYIGETEKKLDKIFEYAQVSNVLLFFDEADALFGKRSEVKDARDKYANAEVSYILARVERFSGAAILATNLMENIDEAFMRRMRFVVNFPIPDKAIRAEIWRSSFPEATPTEDLDIDYIADKCELAGGHIKNIVIKSVFLAAARKRKVTMLDIMESIRDEYNKLGKNINISEFFPEYAHYVKQHSIFK